MPLGLTCGHKFCTDCILHAAGGLASQCDVSHALHATGRPCFLQAALGSDAGLRANLHKMDHAPLRVTAISMAMAPPAAGLDDSHGSLRAVLAEAPQDAACPECRQTGVFEGALLMKKLGGAINRRYVAPSSLCLCACGKLFAVRTSSLHRARHLPLSVERRAESGTARPTPPGIGRRYPQEMRQHAKEAAQKRTAARRPPWYDKAQTLMAPFAAGL
jgi:hypothetical protein